MNRISRPAIAFVILALATTACGSSTPPASPTPLSAGESPTVPPLASSPLEATTGAPVASPSSGGLHTATALALGDASCAILSGGTVECWGSNFWGQVGDGTKENPLGPVLVRGVIGATVVAPSMNYTCAVLSDGTARCWGHNPDGELGDGTRTDSITPVAVTGIATATAIAVPRMAGGEGGFHTCALLSDGTVKCWGGNWNGTLGDGTTWDQAGELPNGREYSTTPVAVQGITTATAIVSGGNFTCALLSGGTVKCWGGNASGELGDETAGPYSSTPVAVRGITTATAITAGGAHACALLSDGTAMCWGYASSGQLGDGTGLRPDGTPDVNAHSATPVAVKGLTRATAISAGSGSTCALLSGGTVACWGNNGSGQLGFGDSLEGVVDPEFSLSPVVVEGIEGATAVEAGNGLTCALLSEGTVTCWGSAVQDGPVPFVKVDL